MALAWMDHKETTGLPCSGGILADDQVNLIYSNEFLMFSTFSCFYIFIHFLFIFFCDSFNHLLQSQGLGKTVSTIALIQKQIHLQKKFTSNQSERIASETLNLDDDDNTARDVEKTEHTGGNSNPKLSSLKAESSLSTISKSAFVVGRPAAGTLVVCPASILRQWSHELKEKVTEEAKLSVLIYHGGSRTKDPVNLSKYDVVLTTYAIVTNEVPKKVGDDDGERKTQEEYGLAPEFSSDKKRKTPSSFSNKRKKKGKGLLPDIVGGPLSGVRWFRVILDEAQIIKNHRTKVARACCGLRAKRRWCLSGTPMQNAIDDIYSYFRFLRYEPYATFPSFCSAIKAPILRNADIGYKKLQAVLKAVMLRRTKGLFYDFILFLKWVSTVNDNKTGEGGISLTISTYVVYKTSRFG